MNYGKHGITQKKKQLNSSSTKVTKKVTLMGVKLLLILGIGLIVIAACLGLGAIHGIIASAPDINTIDVSPDGYATKIYDVNGTETQSLSTSGSNRISVDIEQVPLNLQHAFVAIEDERFYEHNGIDIRGILRAAATAVTDGGLSQGASTITQQLLKNNVFNAYNETSIEKIKRKIQEQYLALKLETIMDKTTILENYLNTINLGHGYYGVQAAANGYFNKDVSELTLSECAVIASITQNPAGLNPIRYPERNKERQRRVLEHMLDQGYITTAEYDEAVNDDVYARLEGLDIEGEGSAYSYFVDTLIDQIINDLVEQKGYTETQATNLIYKGGLNVYSTQDIKMQEIADSVLNAPENYGGQYDFSISSYSIGIKDTQGQIKYYSHYSMLEYFQKTLGKSNYCLTYDSTDKSEAAMSQYRDYLTKNGETVVSESFEYTVQPQVSFSLIDHTNGYVHVLVGGRGEKTGHRTFNRATDSTRQPGSAIKPLVAYGPAIDLGVINIATPIDDAPYYYSGADRKLVSNNNVGEFQGLMNVRKALENSQNVPAVKVLTAITPEVGFSYLQKMNFQTIISKENAVNGHHDVVQALALGGMTYGVYNIDMCGAYGAIANGGVYNKPIYYTKVTDREGNVLLDNTENTPTTVFKASTAALLTDALESVFSDGTAQAAKIDSMPSAGKTGTTQVMSDKWTCGYTPYYTAVIWMGYDDNSGEVTVDRNTLWRYIMEDIHKDLPYKDFKKTNDIVEAKVCSQSGLLAVEGLCDKDPRGSQIITEVFTKESVPTKTCDCHVAVTVCSETGEIASKNCTNTETAVFINKSNIFGGAGTDSEKVWDGKYMITEEKLKKLCTKHSGTGNNASTGVPTQNTLPAPSQTGTGTSQ